MGVMGAGLGVWIIKEAFYLNHHVLFLGWVEQKWGPGRGTEAYRIIGLILIIFSIFVMLGQVNLFSSPYDSSRAPSNRSQQVQTAPGSRSNIAP